MTNIPQFAKMRWRGLFRSLTKSGQLHKSMWGWEEVDRHCCHFLCCVVAAFTQSCVSEAPGTYVKAFGKISGVGVFDSAGKLDGGLLCLEPPSLRRLVWAILYSLISCRLNLERARNFFRNIMWVEPPLWWFCLIFLLLTSIPHFKMAAALTGSGSSRHLLF